MNALPESNPIRGLMAATILQARRDVRTAMRRARAILKRNRRGKPLDQHHRLGFGHVQAAHWVATVSTDHLGFDSMCVAVGLDAATARAEITLRLDRALLKRALRVQFQTRREFEEWLRAGCDGRQYFRRHGMAAFEECRA